MRYKYLLFDLLMLCLVVITPAARAMLHLELTQGAGAAIPIAITSFAGEIGSDDQKITSVITNDLQNSGQFRVKNEAQPVDLPSFNAGYWRRQGVDHVLMGSVKSTGDQYQVSVQLVSIFSKNGAADKPQVLFEQSFHIPQNGSRTLAHHISDLVYQQLTGVRGVFSTKIAYIEVQRLGHGRAQYTLEVADADGYNPRKLLTSPLPIMSPTWSPDGHHLAYVSFEGHRAAIYLQDIRSAGRSVISRYPGINGAPAFSPDGRKLALVLTQTDNPKIFILDLNSKRLTQLTQGYSIDTEPNWSPDGRSLIYTSNTGGTPQIYRYDFASGKSSRLSYQGDYNARASFLPDGRSFIMMHRQGGTFSIAAQNLGSGQFNVLTGSGSDESPSLAPNGKMVLYASRSGGHGVLGVVSIDGRVKLILPTQAGDVQEPAWSPFLS